MTAETIIPALYVFALAAFLGYLVLSRVPPLLHTPLMSATNAISGISLVGSIVAAGAQHSTTSTILGPLNIAASVPFHASQMFSKNVQALVTHLSKDGNLVVDASDEISGPMTVVRDGQVVAR